MNTELPEGGSRAYVPCKDCQIEMARRVLSAPFDHYWSGGEKAEYLVNDLLGALGLTGEELLALGESMAHAASASCDLGGAE